MSFIQSSCRKTFLLTSVNTIGCCLNVTKYILYGKSCFIVCCFNKCWLTRLLNVIIGSFATVFYLIIPVLWSNVNRSINQFHLNSPVIASLISYLWWTFLFVVVFYLNIPIVSRWQNFKDLYLECCNPIIKLNYNHDSKLASPEPIDSYLSSMRRYNEGQRTIQIALQSFLAFSFYQRKMSSQKHPYKYSNEHVLTRNDILIEIWFLNCFDWNEGI